MCFFDLLRISPSYEMARQLEAGTLPPGTEVPSYFDDVLRTYQEFGDVTGTRFQDWMQHTFKRKVEDAPDHKPAVLQVIHEGMEHEAENIETNLHAYLQGAAQQRHSADTLVLAVPLGLPREMLLGHITTILIEQEARQRAMYLDPQGYDDEYNRPKLWRDRGTRIVVEGVELLTQYAEDQALGKDSWQTGKLFFSNIVTGVKYTQKEIHIKLTKRVGTDIKKYKLVCENASRGYFVSAEQLDDMPAFDFPAIHRRLQAIEAWEESEAPSRQPLELMSLRPEHTMVTLYNDWLAETQQWYMAAE